MTPPAWYFAFFLVSGFASLVYEVVWLRLAMAAFGVTTPLVSTVLSIFMAGLALGSIGGGRLAQRIAAHPGAPLRAYALAELVIGAGSLLVPLALRWGRAVLLADESRAAWDSTGYYVASAAWVAAALLPYCVAMGATFPLALAAIRQAHAAGTERAFSYLYLANVIGATAGALATALVLVEILGFHATLLVAGSLNALLVVGAVVLSVIGPRRGGAGPRTARATPDVGDDASLGGAASRPPATLLVGLGLTGLASLAMEVVWLRQFAPYLGPEVYTFATVLATYLAATSVGSRLYRAFAPRAAARLAAATWIVVPALALLPLAATDPRLPLGAALRLVLGIAPFCVAVAVLTPMLVDRWSAGVPDRAGTAYAMNVLGSIAGPLLAGFVLLPVLGERGALIALALPMFAAGALVAASPSLLARDHAMSGWLRGTLLGGTVVTGLALGTLFVGWESNVAGGNVRHDHTATVVAAGSGRKKHLFVNGHGATSLTSITKWMAHLPLAHLGRAPGNAVVIGFGMGTSFRSALAWGIPVTAVDLVPSVPSFFGFYHADAEALLRRGAGRVVVDDGRRFLERSTARWDVIIVDPPPPTEAAGSSLLYSREFYGVVRRRLAPDGILQQWVPVSEPAIMVSVARTLAEVFPHVRMFPGIDPETRTIVGLHFLARERPLPRVTGETLAERLPEVARADLLEWTPGMTAAAVFAWILQRETSLAILGRAAPLTPGIEDDRPFNEYYLLRRWLGWLR